MVCAGSLLQVPQEAVGAVEGVELLRLHEEGGLQFNLRPGKVAGIVNPIGIVGHDGVPETVGGSGEFLGDARVHGWVEAVDRR